MTDREFWQAVYVAAIHAGKIPVTARAFADIAVYDLNHTEANTQ